MNVSDIIKLKFKKELINEDYLNWYLFYVYSYQDIELDPDLYTEKHHILSQKSFPEYASFTKHPENKVILPASSHFIAHYLMMLAIKTAGHASAFHLMKNTSKSEKADRDTQSQLYASARETVMSLFSISRIGKKHKPSSIQKMKDNNGLVGKNAYYNIADGKSKFFAPNEIIPHNYTPDTPKSISDRCSKIQSGLLVYHNKTTGEQVKCKLGEEKDGFVRGRSNFGKTGNPFKNKILFKNFKTGENLSVDKSSFNGYEHFCGIKTSKFAYILYDKYVSFTPGAFVNINPLITAKVVVLCSCQTRVRKIMYFKLTQHEFFDGRTEKSFSEFGIRKVDIEEYINDAEMVAKLEWV